MRENIKVRSGNRIAVMLDGKQIGMIQSVRLNDDYGPEPASGIGDIHVQEYVPTMARHSLSVSTMVLRRGALLEAGIAVENGDGALLGMVFDIMVFSKDDGTLLRKYIDCTHASGDMEVTKHAIVMQNVSMFARDVSGLGA